MCLYHPVPLDKAPGAALLLNLMAGADAVCSCKMEATPVWYKNCDAEALSSEMIRKD